MNLDNKPFDQVYPYVLNNERDNKTALNNKLLFPQATKTGNGTVRYFSGTDAEIYFEDQYIDDITQIAFSLQQNTMPLFGYNSYTWDEVALGARTISGQFAINFTKASYLFEVLEVLRIATNAQDMTVATNNIDPAEINKPETKINNKGPLWNKKFNIIMSYGNAYKEQAPYSTLLVLKDVQITGNAQQFDTSGVPILEIYSFIARDIEFVPKTETGANSTTDENTETVTEEATPLISFEDVYYEEVLVEEISLEAEMAYRRYGVEPVASKIDKGEIVLNYTVSPGVKIKKILIEPIFTIADRISEPGTRQVSGDLKSPIRFRVYDEVRYDIRTYASNVYNLNEFETLLMITYAFDGQEQTEEFMLPTKIKRINS